MSRRAASVETPELPKAAPARILEAATGEFAERGYDGARIEAIARRAGVNKALLYYYFPSKGELYRNPHAIAEPTQPIISCLA